MSGSKYPFPVPGNGQPQMQVHLPPDAQRACQCGCPVFAMAFLLYEVPTPVIGQKAMTAMQIFICLKCGTQAGEGNLKPIETGVPLT